MDRSELTELHYITAISNVPSILQHGLLSHERAAHVPHRSVAMDAIQARRSLKKVPGGRSLHEYVNLYINGRNVMLSKVLYGSSMDEICVLRISPAAIDLPRVVIADQNAASDYVRFADASAGLALVRRDTVFAEYWTHPDDQIAEWRHKSAMCAEVLIPDTVGRDLVLGAFVGTKQAEHDVKAVAAGLAVSVNEYMFFT